MKIKRPLVIAALTALVCIVVVQAAALATRRDPDMNQLVGPLPTPTARRQTTQELHEAEEAQRQKRIIEEEQKRAAEFDLDKPAGLIGPERFSPKERENQWIVRCVLTDLLRMVWQADGKEFPLSLGLHLDDSFDGPAFKYSTNLGHLQKPVLMDGGALEVEHIWDYRGYAKLVKANLPKAKAGQPPPDDANILADLLSPTSEEFLKWREKLNAKLAKDMADSTAHVQAACLKGTFALLNTDGIFTDVREDLNRITAHLAMAAALDPASEDTDGFRVAKAILLTLCGRCVDAEETLRDAFTGPDPAVIASWKAMLRLRITKDWRNYSGSERAHSIIERIELLRTTAECKGIDQARMLAEQLDIPPFFIPAKYTLNEDVSHPALSETTERVMMNERRRLADIQRQYKLDPAYERTNDIMAPYLLNDSRACDVLPIENWINAIVRSTLNCAWLRYQLYYRRLGNLQIPNVVYGPADFTSGSQLARAFNTMLYDGYEEVGHEQENRKRDYLESARLMAELPHLVTLRFWYEYSLYCGSHQLHIPGNKILSCWTRSGDLPYGTAYGVPSVWNMGGLNFGKKPQIEAAYLLHPTDIVTKYRWFEQNKGTLPVGHETTLAGFLKDDIAINPRALRRLANETSGSPESAVSLLQTYAQNDKNGLIDLAHAYAKIDDKEMAEKTFLQAFAEAPDRIYVSNAMDWLVDRLHATGRTKQAIEIADYCHQVGSGRGIRVRALLAEKMGDLALAEQILQEIVERYGDDTDLDNLWSRRREEFLRQVNPNGPVPVDEKSLPKPPAFGALVLADSEKSIAGGLRKSMIIVSVDGFRVTTKKEYVLLRSMRGGNSISLIFWDGLQYQKSEILTNEERRLGIALGDLPRPKNTVPPALRPRVPDER